MLITIFSPNHRSHSKLGKLVLAIVIDNLVPQVFAHMAGATSTTLGVSPDKQTNPTLMQQGLTVCCVGVTCILRVGMESCACTYAFINISQLLVQCLAKNGK